MDGVVKRRSMKVSMCVVKEYEKQLQEGSKARGGKMIVQIHCSLLLARHSSTKLIKHPLERMNVRLSQLSRNCSVAKHQGRRLTSAQIQLDGMGAGWI